MDFGKAKTIGLAYGRTATVVALFGAVHRVTGYRKQIILERNQHYQIENHPRFHFKGKKVFLDRDSPLKDIS